MDVPDSSFRRYTIEQPEALHHMRGLVPLAHAALAGLGFVDLPVVAADLTLRVIVPEGFSVRMAADAPRVDAVGLLKAVADPYLLRDVAVGHFYLDASGLKAFSDPVEE